MPGAWTNLILADHVETEVVHSPGFKARFGSLAAHPYDRENPDRTVWWLFPRSRTPWGNWPAYSLGKFFFDRPRGRGVLRAGLHIEKGVDPANAEAFGRAGRGKFFGMTQEWAWFDFVKDMQSGRVEAALADMAERSGEAVEVTIEPSYPLDEPVLRERFGYHRFEMTAGGQLRLVEERATTKLPQVGQTRSLKELGTRFARATTEEPWTWINAFFCIAVPYSQSAPPGAGPCWRGEDFWRRALEPLAGWVR